jgi:galactose mutarotase-like enzyme
LIWNAQADIWPRHAPLLFPIVGKLKDNKIKINQQEFQLGQHGFARDLTFELLEIYSDAISMVLNASPATIKMWPFEFRLIVSYQLTASGFITTYTVINTDNEQMPFSIGGHPGFLLPVADLNEYSIKLNTNIQIICYSLQDGLLTENTLTLSNNNSFNLHKELFKNDALVFKHIDFDTIELIHQKSGFTIKQTLKGFNYYGIWNKYPTQSFICLEPWAGIADSINSTHQIKEKEGLLWLHPGQQKTFEFKTEFTL